jgi:hypothetical protein
MSAEDLQAGHDWITRKFYSPWRIVRRLWRHARQPNSLASLPYLIAVNMAYYGRVLNWNIRGFNPAITKRTQKHTGPWNFLNLVPVLKKSH